MERLVNKKTNGPISVHNGVCDCLHLIIWVRERLRCTGCFKMDVLGCGRGLQWSFSNQKVSSSIPVTHLHAEVS